MVKPEDIKRWIEDNLSEADVEISGDGHHFEATIVCPAFAGKSRIQRHQMVYGALGDRMKSEIHALSMRTLTPEQRADEQGARDRGD
jgi:acid stress-induced BolA-like protein IbaG/YrbA